MSPNHAQRRQRPSIDLERYVFDQRNHALWTFLVTCRVTGTINQIFEPTSRYASVKAVGITITNNDRASSDYDTRTDGYTRQNGGIRTDPGTLSDADRRECSGSSSTQASTELM